MGAGGTAAVVVAVGALGVLAGAKLFGGPAAPPPGEVEAKVREAEARLRAEIEGLKAGHGKALKALEAERDEARKRAVEAEAAGAAARQEVEEARAALEASRPAVPAGAEAPAAAKGPRFALGEYEAVLRDLDWRTIGGNMQQMVPLLEALARGIAEGKPLDGEGLGRIQQLNGPLVTAALKIGDRIPGSGINAKFTHPVFSSNAMAFALEAAKLPLTDRQAEALGKLAQEFADRDRARIAGYDERAWALQKVLDEASLREDFFEAAFGILTESQGAALRPAATRGLLSLDLFSTGLLWQQHLVPVFAPDRAGAGGVVKAQAATWLAIPEEKRAALDPFIAEWVAAVPDSLLAGGGMGMAGVKAADVEALARTQVALMRRIVESQSFGDAVAGKARDIGGVLLPIKQ
jgi:hypothetical protein